MHYKAYSKIDSVFEKFEQVVLSYLFILTRTLSAKEKYHL